MRKMVTVSAAVAMFAGSACAQTLSEQISVQKAPSVQEQTVNGSLLRTVEDMFYLCAPKQGFLVSTPMGVDSLMAVRTGSGYQVRADIYGDEGKDLKLAMKISSGKDGHRLEGSGIRLELKPVSGNGGKYAVTGKAGDENINLSMSYWILGTEPTYIKVSGKGVSLDFNHSGNPGGEIKGSAAVSNKTLAAVISIVLAFYNDDPSFGDI